MPAGYEFRAGQLLGQLGSLPRYALAVLCPLQLQLCGQVSRQEKVLMYAIRDVSVCCWVVDQQSCIKHAGRVEFTSFLPENTQAAIIQPIGNDGVLIAASNTQRGFTRLDQVSVCPTLVTASTPA